MDIIRKIRRSRLTADTLTDPNVPAYIKAGFKTNLNFLEWLGDQPETEWNKWGYSSWGQISEEHMDELLKKHGLPPVIKCEGSGAFVVPSGRHIED